MAAFLRKTTSHLVTGRLYYTHYSARDRKPSSWKSTNILSINLFILLLASTTFKKLTQHLIHQHRILYLVILESKLLYSGCSPVGTQPWAPFVLSHTTFLRSCQLTHDKLPVELQSFELQSERMGNYYPRDIVHHKSMTIMWYCISNNRINELVTYRVEVEVTHYAQWTHLEDLHLFPQER